MTAARWVAAEAATRRVPTMELVEEKTVAPIGVAVGVAAGSGVAAEAAALVITVILDVLVNRQINESISFHVAAVAKTFQHFKHISINFCGDCLLCNLFHIFNILMMIIPIITIIRYMMISCTFGALKLYMMICFVSEISKVFILEDHVVVYFGYT